VALRTGGRYAGLDAEWLQDNALQMIETWLVAGSEQVAMGMRFHSYLLYMSRTMTFDLGCSC
jgi:hypothetical protein